jgi:glucose-1-phosphate cytidylyltransferase
MRVLILAGGVGTRLQEETEVKPKPMVEIGDRPILWHIMKHYAHHGFDDFVVALGYKGEVIKRYFTTYAALTSDLTVDLGTGTVTRLDEPKDQWQVTLVDTGQQTETAGRMLAAREHLGEGTFMMTYGDGVADVDLGALLAFHRSHGLLATVTAVHPVARFGQIEMDGDRVRAFAEKPQMTEGWINGGFFVLEPGVFDVIPGDCDWSKAPMERLAAAGQLAAYRHDGFWQCMDTLRDKLTLEDLWRRDRAPWRTWA